MTYARRPLSRLRTDFSRTSPAVIAFWERSASRPESRAVRVATMSTTKAAASSTAAAALNNSIRAERDLAMPTGEIDRRRASRLYWARRRSSPLGVRGLQHVRDRPADHHRAADHAHPLDLEVAEVLGHPLGGQVVGGLRLLL